MKGSICCQQRHEGVVFFIDRPCLEAVLHPLERLVSAVVTEQHQTRVIKKSILTVELCCYFSSDTDLV